MSKDIQGEEHGAEEPAGGESADAPQADPEQELEYLADRIAEVIQASPGADREALHDYAVSLVRERLPVAAELLDPDAALTTGADTATISNGGGVQSLGYGILLVPVGFFLFWIFPFIGVMLAVAGATMIVWGAAIAVASKLRPSAIGNHENT